MVPRKVQLLVYRHYQDGQCQLEPMPSEKWHAAANMAIASVANKEGLITDESLHKVIEKSKTVIYSEAIGSQIGSE